MLTSPATHTKTGLLINRNFALLWTGQTISFIGDAVFEFTLTLWIAFDLGKGQAWAPLAVSGVLASTSIATLVVGPVAGVFIDRWDKRRAFLWTLVAQGVLVTLTVLATDIVPLPFIAGGTLPVTWKLAVIYVDVFLVYACAQFTRPARLALLGDIVPAPYRGQASGLMEVVVNLSLLIGFSIAPIIFVPFDASWAIVIDAASFVIAIVAALAIRAPASARSVLAHAQGHWLREFREGIRFYFRSRVLRTLLVAFVVTLLGAGAINALYVFFLTQNLHAPVASLGLFTVVFGVSLLCGALLANPLIRWLGLTGIIGPTFLMTGIAIVAMSRQTALAPALVLAVFVAFPQGVTNVALTPILLHESPRDMVGRLSAILSTAVMLAQVVSIATVGALASTTLAHFHQTVLGRSFGTYDTILLFAGVLGIMGAVYAWWNLRGVKIVLASSPAPAETTISPSEMGE